MDFHDTSQRLPVASTVSTRPRFSVTEHWKTEAACLKSPLLPSLPFVLPLRRYSMRRAPLTFVQIVAGDYLASTSRSRHHKHKMGRFSTGDSCAGAPFAGWWGATKDSVNASCTKKQVSGVAEILTNPMKKTGLKKRSTSQIRRQKVQISLILRCLRFAKFCWVGKHKNVIMKLTNSPTQGQPNPRKRKKKS